MKEHIQLLLSTTVLQAVVFLLVECQPIADPPTAEPTAEPTAQRGAFRNRGAALAVAIVIIVLIVCCCCCCCYKKQITERYEAYRHGGAAGGGGQQEIGNYGNYPPPQGYHPGASAPVMPVAQVTINPGGGVGMVFGPDGKPI